MIFFEHIFSPLNNSWKDLILQMTSDHCKMFDKAYTERSVVKDRCVYLIA